VRGAARSIEQIIVGKPDAPASSAWCGLVAVLKGIFKIPLQYS